jgi:hypothetical protein
VKSLVVPETPVKNEKPEPPSLIEFAELDAHNLVLFNTAAACPEKADISFAFQSGHCICLLHTGTLMLELIGREL